MSRIRSWFDKPLNQPQSNPISARMSGQSGASNNLMFSYHDIHSAVQQGDFYRSLSSDDPDSVIILPETCVPDKNLNPTTVEEFSQLLRIATFWILDSIPIGILNFCSKRNVDVWRRISIDRIDPQIMSLLRASYEKSSEEPPLQIAKSDRWKTIMHLLQHIPKNSDAAAVAGYANIFQILKHFHAQGYDWYSEMCTEACARGDLECLKLAYAHGGPWNSHTVDRAALNGHLHCLQYALEKGCPRSENATYSACAYGDQLCLQLLLKRNVKIGKKATTAAAGCPDVACLRMLHRRGCTWHTDVPEMSARRGYIDPLRYALTHGCPYIEKRLFKAAVEGGSLRCIKYLCKVMGFRPTSQDIFIAALLRGVFPCLVYLIAQGCPCATARYRFTNAELHKLSTILKCSKHYVRYEFMQRVKYAMAQGRVENASNVYENSLFLCGKCASYCHAKSYPSPRVASACTTK